MVIDYYMPLSFAQIFFVYVDIYMSIVKKIII